MAMALTLPESWVGNGAASSGGNAIYTSRHRAEHGMPIYSVVTPA